MPHIHTMPNQHDHTVTAYIVRIDDGEPRVLLHRHKYLGKLLPLGGHIELDETPWVALLREIEEESGYDASQLMILQPPLRIRQEDILGVTLHPQPLVMNTHKIISGHYHSDAGYALLTHELPVRSPVGGESTDIRWLTRRELIALPSEDIRPNTRNTYMALIDSFLEAWEPMSVHHFSTGK